MTKAKETKADTKAEATAPDPVDMDALREQIRAEEADKLRAEMVDRQEAEAAKQAEMDAANSELVMVVCAGSNVHTSKGKITKGMKKRLPENEAALLSKKGLVNPA